jgi:hypothetical protein
MTKKIIIALIGMAALYGCKPKDPCDSEVKSDADKYLLQSNLWFHIKDKQNNQLIFSKYQPQEIKMYDEQWQMIPLDYPLSNEVDKFFIAVKASDILKNELVGTGAEFQCKRFLKIKNDIDTLQIWANIKKLTCSKDYTDRLQVQQNNLPVQNLILNNGEVKYNIRQPYERGFTIFK